MNKLDQRGFTLVEVLAVVAIIAILGLITVPSVLNTINAGKNSSYEILVQDIKTASVQLFEELEFIGDDLFLYDNDGRTTYKISVFSSGTNTKIIEVNLQTLVSNGFLSGINNDDSNNGNKNKKIILNPKTKDDIGECKINIIKTIETGSKVSYVIEAVDDVDGCPTIDDYK